MEKEKKKIIPIGRYSSEKQQIINEFTGLKKRFNNESTEYKHEGYTITKLENLEDLMAKLLIKIENNRPSEDEKEDEIFGIN